MVEFPAGVRCRRHSCVASPSRYSRTNHRTVAPGATSTSTGLVVRGVEDPPAYFTDLVQQTHRRTTPTIRVQQIRGPRDQPVCSGFAKLEVTPEAPEGSHRADFVSERGHHVVVSIPDHPH